MTEARDECVSFISGSYDLNLEIIGYVIVITSSASVWNSGPIPIPYQEVYFGVLVCAINIFGVRATSN